MRTSLDYKDVLVEMQASILDSRKLMKKIRGIADERIREIASLLAGGFDIGMTEPFLDHGDVMS